MAPNRKFKNHGPDGLGLVLLAGILCFVTFTVFVLDNTHKKNIEKLKQDKPAAQQYVLNQSDPIWFCKPDKIGWTKGEVLYLWGYYPVIFSKDLNKTFEFKEVEWAVGHE